MKDQGAPEAIVKEDDVEKTPWGRYSPRSHIRSGSGHLPQQDLHTSMSQEKLFSWGLAEEQRQMGWGTQQLRDMWGNSQEREK